MKNIFYTLIFLLTLQFTIHYTAQAQGGGMSEETRLAHWIFIVSDYVEWQGTYTQFIVGTYGTSASFNAKLKDIAKLRGNVHGLPIKIEHYRKIQDIRTDKLNVIFVANKHNDIIDLIFDKVKNNNTLIITDHLEDWNYAMVNLKLDDKNNQVNVNKKNIPKGIIVNEKLLARGGTKGDVQRLYDKKAKQLEAKEKELQEKENRLLEKEKEIKKLSLENKKKEEDLRLQKYELVKKQRELDSQKTKAQTLLQKMSQVEEKLKSNLKILDNQEKQIKEKQLQIERKNKELEDKVKEIKKREEKIKLQEQTLSKQSSQIEQQKTVIIGSIVFILIVMFMAFLIWRGYRAKKRINAELRSKNIEINRQKEEISKQAEQLEQINKELEKLSIVASQTQNAVIIMDKNGYFEWVNTGFTRLYGYTLQLLRNELDENIVNVSTNPHIRNILHKCVNNKETVTYESLNKSRDGRQIWVQTTLTPILDNEGNVSKLVAIDADITKLKEQEQAIRQQSEELRSQKDELMEQKERIELQNKQIHASIRYAQTIQKSILPIDENIQKYFDTFIIFRPKDIVSGDFYWFTEVERPGKNSLKFAAVVDCTGHGVPGAFMSMIGSRLLNEIVNEKGIYSTKDILEQLNKSVIKALKQDKTDNNDGMDAVIVSLDRIDQNHCKITYTGAKRPLFYFTHKDGQVNMLKADRKSIGGVRGKRSPVFFTNKEIVLESDDILYLTSDGLMDQNNAERKRFGTDRFFALLKKIADKPLNAQKIIIETELAEFQKNEEQRDDITIWALKLKKWTGDCCKNA